jgi:ADP-ribose pyrophosphatase YjhB (NUDIX family)
MDKHVIFAAGGIVWDNAKNPRLAIVFRTRYGEEWSLPKGKKNQEESWEQTALREVREETGLNAEIIKYAGTINYLAKGKPKVVIFWHMRSTGVSSKPRDPEAICMKWVSIKEALSTIKYEEEKELLEQCGFPLIEFRKNMKKAKAFDWTARWKSLFSNAIVGRLRGDLETYRSELESVIKRSNAPLEHWSITAQSLLDKTESYVSQGEVDIGWKTLHTSRRQQIFGMSPDQLQNYSSMLRIEAEKLNEWRKKVVVDLLGEPGHPRNNITADMVYLAASLRDEHFNNSYYKNNLIRNTYSFLVVFLFVVLGLILVYVGSNNLETMVKTVEGHSSIPENQFFVVSLGIVLFGLLGAGTSAILKISSASKVTRIPEIVNNAFVTSVRVLLGGALAYITLFFLQTDFVDSLFSFKTKFSNIQTYFVIAFVAGFSERMVLRAVETVSGKE